jgi:hypothetical protein
MYIDDDWISLVLRTIEGGSNCDGRQIIIVNHENAFIGCVP